MRLYDFDLRVDPDNPDWLQEYDEDANTWEFIINLAGMTPVQRAACIIDMTAELGLPELVYRKRLPGEDDTAKAQRLRKEGRQNARNTLLAALTDRSSLTQAVQEVCYRDNGAVNFWDHTIDADMIVDAIAAKLLER